MEYRTIPATDLKVSRVALGCWTFSGGDRWGEVDDDESIAAIRKALDEGITLFDTAEVYGDGRSETVLGRGLAGRRSEAVIASKVHYRDGGFAHDRVIRACESSLARLGTDTIDLYQLHWPIFGEENPAETVAALERLKEAGKIRYYGVCNAGVGQLAGLLDLGTPVTNQLPYSPLWRGIEDEIVPRTLDAGMGILPYSGLVGGLLSGHYEALDQVPEGRRAGKHLASPEKARETFRAINMIMGIAQEAGVSTPALVFAWLLSRKGVTSVLAGARTPAQVKANATIHFLDQEILNRVTKATEQVKTLHGADADFYQTPGRIW